MRLGFQSKQSVVFLLLLLLVEVVLVLRVVC